MTNRNITKGFLEQPWQYFMREKSEKLFIKVNIFQDFAIKVINLKYMVEIMLKVPIVYKVWLLYLLWSLNIFTISQLIDHDLFLCYDNPKNE